MSVGGLASGLNTDDIITKIMEIAKRPQKRLEISKLEAQAKLAEWQNINTRVLATKMQIDNITKSSFFESKKVFSSNTDIMTVSASSTAAEGTYFMKVLSKAQAHQIASQSFNSIDTNIGTGKVSISMANSESFDVDIDTNNNTLAGLRDSINRAGKDVRASIINAGTTESPQYKLLLTSIKTGADYQMTVDTSQLVGGQTPIIDQEVQSASNAQIQLGEGAGAIIISKSTNIVSDLIPGVTLNISSADPTKTVKIEVQNDINGIKSGIQQFVEQYNDLLSTIDSQFKYDSETKESGTLIGSVALQTIQSDLLRVSTSSVPGLTPAFSALSSIGITLNNAGRLIINDATLTNALTNNLNDVKRLFAVDMQSESTYVSYLSSTTDTQNSGSAGWRVNITQPATQTRVTAGVEMSGVLDADEVLTINGKTVNLTAGMTQNQILQAINNMSKELGVTASFTQADGTGSGNYLTIKNISYGATRNVSVQSSLSNQSGVTSGIGNIRVSLSSQTGEGGSFILEGADVAGTINGQPATGKGQTLTANPSTPGSPIKGLQLTITAVEPIQTRVTFTKGVGATLKDMMDRMTSVNGALTTASNSVSSEIEELQKTIDDWNSRLKLQEQRLWQQFNAMESQLARLQSQGDYLMGQLRALNNNNSR
ncbi:MAG: flagellar filament capping protein FliD [Armatimonadota bacterium]